MNSFKYIDRNREDSMVLIPGWATDHRIFEGLDLRYNYLIPVEFSPFGFEQSLLEALERNHIERVSLLGWSLGGFLAAEFASKYPGLIDELILVSIRRRYREEELSEIEQNLKKNKKATLYKFYLQSFSKKDEIRWFKDNLFRYYHEKFDLEFLLKGLDYLRRAEVRPELLNKIRDIKIIHGGRDSIAPVEEARTIKKRLTKSRFLCLERAGHIPFLSEDFARWINKTDKEAIKKNFSRCVKDYDQYCDVQDLCGLRLMNMLNGHNPEHILEIGCGTGNYTKLLRERFPAAKIKAMDISADMIEAARIKLQGADIEFSIGDAEKPDLKRGFDLITSNASIHWMRDLEGALLKYKGLLKEDGIILFSAFGPGTFYELGSSLKMLSGEDASISSVDFKDRAALSEILAGLFKEVEVKEENHQERHSSLTELLRKIKHTGTRGRGIDNKAFWTPDTLSKLEKVYKKRFKEIVATYQTFFCKGRR